MAYKRNQRGYITTKPKQSKNDPAVLTGFSGQTMDGEKKGGNEEAISPRTSQGGGRKDAGKAATGGEIIQNAVYSGLNRFNKGLFSTLDFLLPTEFLGEYDLISKGNDYYSGLESKYSDKLEESTADRSEFVQLGAQTLANTAAAAPNAVLAVMSGGTSAAAQGTTSALTATANAAQAGGMLSGVTNAAQGMVNNPLFWSSVGQNLGSSYENAKAKGANEWQAIGSAYTSALLNSALEVGGGVETLPGALKGGASPFAAWANSALTEGLEEPVQSTVSGLSDMLFYDKDKPLFSLSDPNAVIHPGRMGQEFATGTAVGGILGTGQLAGNALYMDIPDGVTGESSANMFDNGSESDIIKYIQIGNSLGASAKNYPIKLPDSSQHVKFAEGQVIEGKVFAGKGTDIEIRDRFRLESTYKVAASEWQKISGNAYIVLDGKQQKAELHWYEANGKIVEIKVKRYFDED